MRLRNLPISLATLALAAISPVGATVIADFTGNSSITQVNIGGPATSASVLTGGASAFSNQVLTATSVGATDITTKTNGGILALSPDFNTTGSGTAAYSGGVLDLSLANSFDLDFLGSDDANWTVSLTLVDSTNASSGPVVFSGSGLGTAASVLSIGAGSFGGVNLSSITQAILSFSTGASVANDLAFDNLRTTDRQVGGEVPEPSSLLLMGTALVGLSAFRKYKK